jgi:hypothetical protein
MDRVDLDKTRESALAGGVKDTERKRNEEAGKINWQFTTADVRIKLKRLYPQFVRFKKNTPKSLFGV